MRILLHALLHITEKETTEIMTFSHNLFLTLKS